MAYIGVSPSNGVRRKHTYTATAAQTSFTGAGAEGITLSYLDSNYVDVYQNGVKLSEADYTSTTGTTVVLATGAIVSDMVEIVVYDVFSVADTVSKSAGGTFDGNITAAGTITVTGNADLNGDLDVDGTSNLDVVDIDGTVNMASTALVTGVLTANGGAVFNEGSADVDFRVESNGNANMIFVDGGNDRVGIGTATLANKLEVDGGSAETRLRVSSTGTDLREAGIILANSSKSNDNDGIVISHGGAVTTFDDLGGNELMRIAQTGNHGLLLIGVTDSTPFGAGAPGQIVALNDATRYGGIFGCDNVANRHALVFVNPNGEVGSIRTNGTGTSFETSSDYRLKENVTTSWDATTRLKQLKPSRFNFIADADTTVDGFLAHEVSSIVPEAVGGAKDAVRVWNAGEELPDGVSAGDNKLDADGNTIPDMQGIDQSKLVPLLVKTIQELEARITALENA